MIKVKLIENKTWPYMTKYPGCFEYITPYYLSNGRIYTGFDETNEAERIKLEKELHTDLSPGSEYWINYFIKMNDEELRLNENDPVDRQKIIFLSRHKDAAFSGQRIDPTKKFVIIDEEKVANDTNTKEKMRRKVIIARDSMSDEDIRNAIRLYGINPEGVSMPLLENKLDEEIAKNYQKFADLWINNPDRTTWILFYNAFNKGLIRRSKGYYYYNSETIGNSPETVVAYLSEDKNIETRQAIVMTLDGTFQEPIKRGYRKEKTNA